VSFVTAIGLAVALLVVFPYMAHRLRRRRAEERPFAGAHLVPAAPPRARRRSQLEDRALFALRAASVIALAGLAASPLVRCSRLSLHREGGASIAMAIVLDDSMSMRATFAGGTTTRFDRAMRGARELLGSAREGDAIAIVLAGAPPRVALAATTDLAAARAALSETPPSDRGTDLDGAIAMARALVSQLPQVDRRIVVLSDLADGHPDGPPLGEGESLPVWVALPELREDAKDCGIISADRLGVGVRVTLACGPGAVSAGREVTVRAGDDVVARAPAPMGAGGDVSLTLPGERDKGDLVAHLEGMDAIAADDVAAVVPEAAAPAIAIVADATEEATATGGAPILEQAMTALHLDVALRPIPAVPDRAEDLAGFLGVIVDDPPGLTPEERRAVGAFLDRGGELLVALGPHAAAAPLGATFEPVLSRGVAWGETKAKGAAEAGAAPRRADAASRFTDLGARSRATLAPEDAKSFATLIAWSDGAPLVAKRTVGTLGAGGDAWVVTLPFAVGASDLTLRPGFLGLLAAWADEVRAHAVPVRIDVGVPWVFRSGGSVAVDGPGGALGIARDGPVARAAPPVIGVYEVTVAGKTERRVAAPIPAEMNLRPRKVVAAPQSHAVGDDHASVDVSWVVALALLTFVAAELALRVDRARRPEVT